MLLFLISTIACSQNYKIPEIPFSTVIRKRSDYYKLLDIKDKNALIVTAGNTRGFYGGIESFLVYNNKGLVRKFTLNNKTHTAQEIAVTIEQSELYWQFLYSYFTLNGKLNGKSSIVVLDGSTDYFTVYKIKESYTLNSYASETYITEKSPE